MTKTMCNSTFNTWAWAWGWSGAWWRGRRG